VKQRRISEETAREVADLFDREEPALLNYAVAMNGGDEQAAKDLVQQTFMAAAVGWAGIRPRDPSKQRAWLRRTCRNKWIDKVRREQRLQGLQSDLVHRYTWTEADPSDVIVDRDVLARCWKVLRSFPPARQRVARLHWVEGYSAAEIATLLGIRPSGVRKHLSQAREVIHREVGPHMNLRWEDDPKDGAVT
jgi:RNA polymerase sigma factor (sigma-70 family)